MYLLDAFNGFKILQTNVIVNMIRNCDLSYVWLFNYWDLKKKSLNDLLACINNQKGSPELGHS